MIHTNMTSHELDTFIARNQLEQDITDGLLTYWRGGMFEHVHITEKGETVLRGLA